MSQEHANDGVEGANGGGDGEGSSDPLQIEQEKEASSKGWTPKWRYKGPEGSWKDAATFLRDGQNYNRTMKAELAAVRAELEQFKGTAKEFAEFQQRQIEDRNSQISALMTDLKRQQRQAIREGDDETADAIDSRLGILTDERAAANAAIEKAKQKPENVAPRVAEDGTTTDPVVTAWIADGNEWFRTNARMRAFAFQTANELIANGESARGRAFLDKLRSEMEEAFPRSFKDSTTNVNRGSGVETNSGGSGGNRPRVEDLPREDLDLMETGIRQGWTTKEKFLSNYFSEGPRVHRTAAKK